MKGFVEENGDFCHGKIGDILREKGTIPFLRGHAHSKRGKEFTRKVGGILGKR